MAEQFMMPHNVTNIIINQCIAYTR